MRSFGLSVFATLAFGIFCSAAPTPVGIPTDVMARGAEVPAQNTQNLEFVINDVVAKINPIKERISQLNTVTATVEVVTPCLEQVKEILECAVEDVKALIDIDVDVALFSITKGVLLDVKGVVDLLSCVLHVVFLLLKCVLQVVTGTVKEAILPLVLEIVCLAGDLAAAVLSLVASVLSGVIAALLPCIADLVDFIIELNVKSVLDILCIKL